MYMYIHLYIISSCAAQTSMHRDAQDSHMHKKREGEARSSIYLYTHTCSIWIWIDIYIYISSVAGRPKRASQ